MNLFKKIVSLVLCAIMVLSIAPIVSYKAEATTKTSTDAINWLKSKEGVGLDYDGQWGCQCVDLIYYYYVYLGASSPGGNACDFTSNTLPSGWTRVKGGTPQKGDIIVYAGGSDYGHIAIYETATSTWHQNIDYKMYVVNVSYNYKNITAADGSGYWGYIRPNFADGGATDSPKVSIDTSSDKYSITNTNAVLCGNIYNPFGAKVSKCGIKLYDENGTLLKDFSNSISFTDSNVEIWFDLNGEVGYTLTQGTKYKYVLYGVVGGKTYSTSTQTFTTTGGYTLSYNANGGSGAPSKQSSLIKYTISSTEPTREGYTFLGWSTSSSATSASYAPGEVITLTKNTTLYAIWEEIPVYNVYELVYDANGGEYAPEAQTFTEDSSVYISEVEPVRFGYVFEGWITEDGYWYYPGQEAMFFESTVLYASWGNHRLSAEEPITLEITDECPEVFVEFVPKESGTYVFESFYTEDTLDTAGILYDEYGNQLGYSDDDGEGYNFKILYALDAGCTYFMKVLSYENKTGSLVFEVSPASFDLYFDANGGSGAPFAHDGDVTYIIPDIIPVREGYTFLGWSESGSATVASYYAGNKITITQDTILYAVWQKKQTGSNTDLSIDILTPSTTKINYKDGIILHASITGEIPDGATVVWECSNDNFEMMNLSSDSCGIISKANGNSVISVKIISEDGEILAQDSQIMTSNAGFFQKIIVFFKGLFGILPKVIPQAFKTAF